MIIKIKKIRNLGLFEAYDHVAALPGFKRFNLVYGWNGTGKTTLSNLFSALESGSISNYPSLEYELETESGSYGQGQPFDRKVRVFNREYVEKNVQILNGRANTIIILGEENKGAAEEIKRDEDSRLVKQKAQKTLSEDKIKLESSKAKRFTDIARIISAETSGEATRRYTAANAKNGFSEIKVPTLITEDVIQKYRLTLRQLVKPILSEFKINNAMDPLVALPKLIEEGNELLARTVEAEILERLKSNPDISDWVEVGVKLHKKYGAGKCEFCGNALAAERVAALARHFNEADKSLKEEIDRLHSQISEAASLIATAQIIDKANLYDELQDAYQSEVTDFVKLRDEVLKGISVALGRIADKKTKTTESMPAIEPLNLHPAISAHGAVNAIIKRHNNKTDNFTGEKQKAQQALELHYLSTIFIEVNEDDKNINELDSKLSILSSEINVLINKVAQNRLKISSPHKACDILNKSLETFLGRREIVFEVADDGYIIKRNGKAVAHLSEGEKTAIAFIYFVVHLEDQHFEKKEGIIVIDDPVSSLDTNSLFQAFAFLKNAVKDSHQVFILTHNFDFLRLLINWLSHETSEYLMVKNSCRDGQRIAYLDAMDKELKNHESEYHYLFKMLKNFESDGTIAQAYPIPNMARKVLETFLTFRVPCKASMYKKLEKIRETTKCDPAKLTAVYKFTNSESHITGGGFDPALVPETQKNVKYLLELMCEVFPEHYKILEESVR